MKNNKDFFIVENIIIKNDTEYFKTSIDTQSSLLLGEEYTRFIHPTYKFSIEYPKLLVPTVFKEPNNGETIVFQSSQDEKTVAKEERMGFQIFITPFNEEDILTKERILNDILSVVVDDIEEVILGTKVGGRDVQAFLFWSRDEKIGKTREVWFVHDGYLYEITTYAHLDSWLANILQTLNF